MSIPVQKPNLTEGERIALSAFVEGPAFPVVRRLMDMFCTLQDAELVGTPNNEREKVLSAHAIAVAKWDFNGEIIDQIKAEVAALSGQGVLPLTDAQKQERENARILDPIREQEQG